MAKRVGARKEAAWALGILAAGCGDAGPMDRPGGASRVELGEPEAAYAEAFGAVRAVREMPGGRVLVADPLGQALVLVDMDEGTADTLGGVGPGPDEYMQPDAVYALPEGRTLLVDLGNSRLTELSADLEFEDSRSFVIGDVTSGGSLALAIPSAVDRHGRLYFRGTGDMMSGVDSAYLLRVDRAVESVDSMARVKTPETIVASSDGGAGEQSTSVRQAPLSPADAWGVAADGRVAIARAGDRDPLRKRHRYHVDWIMLDGSVIQGSPQAYEPLPVSREAKEEWVAARAASGLRVSVEAGGGDVAIRVSRGGGGSSGDDLDAHPWPDVLPPFYGVAIRVDSAGRAWVRVHTDGASASAYDLFGPSAEHEARVELGRGRQVVGFSAAKIYAVRTDDLGRQFLERYRMF